MENYIDGFVLPIPKSGLKKYKNAAEKIAEIWKEHGAIAYFEYVGDDLKSEGLRSFIDSVDLKNDEVVIFGLVIFPSKKTRDKANKLVPNDPRMSEIVGPLLNPNRLIFNAERMVYGGFYSLINSNSKKYDNS